MRDWDKELRDAVSRWLNGEFHASASLRDGKPEVTTQLEAAFNDARERPTAEEVVRKTQEAMEFREGAKAKRAAWEILEDFRAKLRERRGAWATCSVPGCDREATETIVFRTRMDAETPDMERLMDGANLPICAAHANEVRPARPKSCAQATDPLERVVKELGHLVDDEDAAYKPVTSEDAALILRALGRR